MKTLHRFLLLYSVVLSLLVLAHLFPALAAQRQPKFIDQEYSLNYPASAPTSPIEVIDLKVSGKPINLQTKFYDDGEWLRGLSWKIKNNSNKAILMMNIFLTFPQTKRFGPIKVLNVSYGVDPKLSAAKGEVRRIEPNGSAEFSISDSMYENLKKAIENALPLNDVNHLRLSIPFALFEDDSGWSNGRWMKRDPSDPRKWRDLE